MATSETLPRAPFAVSVMISYSRKDSSDFAQKLRNDLIHAGFSTWMDTSDIPGGRLWQREIYRAIDDARVVLVVMSPEAMKSPWVRKEYTYALRRGKDVIPLDYYPCNIPALLAKRQIVTFRATYVNTEAFYAQQFQLLTTTLARYAPLDTPAPAPTFIPSSGRLLTGALALMALVGLLLAVLGVYANGALLPTPTQPYAAWVCLGGVVLVALSFVAQAIRRARRPDAEVNLYLDDRIRFLNKVHTRYDIRLRPPFAGALLVTLGLNEEAQSVAHPSLARQVGPAGTPHPWPTGTTISAAFEDAEEQLLILGAPGAGKSWLLYQLALALVERARADGAMPVPVAFDLASWALNQKPLADWMTDQLTETWQVPPAIARVWVERHQLFPLLDGLDEVRRDAQDACVEAINRYQRDHGLFPLAVCCRKADYDALETRLDLRTAVVAQPLTHAQIDEYLEAGGTPLAALRILAREEVQMQELLSTPLLLNMVALAYEGKAIDTIPKPSEDKSAWTRTVFHDYVPTMLARRLDSGDHVGRKRGVKYSDAETTRYLAWLAAQMRTHGRTDVFYLEQLQPNWLPTDWARCIWRWQLRLGFWLVLGLVFILGFELTVNLGYVAGNGLGYVLGAVFFALAFGLFLWSIVNDNSSSEDISLRASVRVSRPRWRTIRWGLYAGLYAGLSTALVCALGDALASVVSSGPDRVLGNVRVDVLVGGVLTVLFFGLVTMLFAGLVGGLITLVSTASVDEHELSAPNQGVTMSLHSGRVGGALGGLVGGVLVGLVGMLVGWQDSGLYSALLVGLASALFFGLSFGLLFWLRSGLYDYIRHQTLLWALSRRRLIPHHYLDFLDFAADHVLLQRVGGGYRFVHALLLDYFADQWPALSGTEPQEKK